MSIFETLLLIMGLMCGSNTAEFRVHRNKRYFPFPNGVGDKIQIIAGFGIPVELEESSCTVGLIIKTNYELPFNSSQFSQPEEVFGQDSSKMTRWHLYAALESALKSVTLGGNDCLLRSICQAAHTPLGHNGLVGQLLHIILTPSSTSNDPWDGKEDEYMRAEALGRSSIDTSDCITLFPNCSASLLDIITTLGNSILKTNPSSL